jgi:hypothetical protein
MPILLRVTANTALNLRDKPDVDTERVIGPMPHNHIVTKVTDAASPSRVLASPFGAPKLKFLEIAQQLVKLPTS